MSAKKKTYSADFKAKVVLELLSEGSTLNQIASKYEITQQSLLSWKKQFLENASQAFDSSKMSSEYKKELEAWGSGRNAGDVGGIKKDGTWDGQIDGTTESTIFTFRGGWNCRHQIIAVSISQVPKSVIDRNIANGNYKPNK